MCARYELRIAHVWNLRIAHVFTELLLLVRDQLLQHLDALVLTWVVVHGTIDE